MGAVFTEDRQVELSADASHVGAAWLLAIIVVTLLMTVVAPLLSA
jgi:hypothetical protein